MYADIKPVKLVVIITQRAYGKKVIALLNDNGYNFHDAFLGKGTATDELSSYLGLEPEKVIIACFLCEDRARALLKLLDEKMFDHPGRGLAFMLKVNSASSMDVIKLISQAMAEKPH